MARGHVSVGKSTPPPEGSRAMRGGFDARRCWGRSVLPSAAVGAMAVACGARGPAGRGRAACVAYAPCAVRGLR